MFRLLNVAKGTQAVYRTLVSVVLIANILYAVSVQLRKKSAAKWK